MFVFAFVFVLGSAAAANETIQIIRFNITVVLADLSAPQIHTSVMDNKINTVRRIIRPPQRSFNGTVDTSTTPNELIMATIVFIRGAFVSKAIAFNNTGLRLTGQYSTNPYTGYGTLIYWDQEPNRTDFHFKLQRKVLDTVPLADICFQDCVLYN